jgi:hypothetical protein
MLQPVSFDLKKRIIDALTDQKSELYFPHLTNELIRVGQQSLYDETKITEEEYGTARVILKRAKAERILEGPVFNHKDLEEIKNQTFIEMLPVSIKEWYKESDVYFYTCEELRINNEITACLKDAFEIIRHIPVLFKTIRLLVRSVHIIKPEDNEVDISFSEPHIPLSVFVSIPQKNTPINALRVAEAIVHEAMHLQLSFIENLIPLIDDKELFYSPWKKQYRSAQGILHALYVFRVIDNFFKDLLLQNKLSINLDNYLKERRQEISNQINQVQTFRKSSCLTTTGKEFVEHLIFCFN